jgi:hypothetical protein
MGVKEAFISKAEQQLTTWCSTEHLDLSRRKQQEAAEKWMTRSFLPRYEDAQAKDNDFGGEISAYFTDIKFIQNSLWKI